MAYEPRLLCHMNRFYWGWGWSSICWIVYCLLSSVQTWDDRRFIMGGLRFGQTSRKEALSRGQKNQRKHFLYKLNLVARAIRNTIRANRFARIICYWNPYVYSASGRSARTTRISDLRESPDSCESCESICANHATKCTKFCENPSGHGRPRRKLWTSAPKSTFFFAVPVMGRNFLTQGRPGVRVRNVRGKSGLKSLCLLETDLLPLLVLTRRGRSTGKNKYW